MLGACSCYVWPAFLCLASFLPQTFTSIAGKHGLREVCKGRQRLRASRAIVERCPPNAMRLGQASLSLSSYHVLLSVRPRSMPRGLMASASAASGSIHEHLLDRFPHRRTPSEPFNGRLAQMNITRGYIADWSVDAQLPHVYSPPSHSVASTATAPPPSTTSRLIFFIACVGLSRHSSFRSSNPKNPPKQRKTLCLHSNQATSPLTSSSDRHAQHPLTSYILD